MIFLRYCFVEGFIDGPFDVNLGIPHDSTGIIEGTGIVLFCSGVTLGTDDRAWIWPIRPWTMELLILPLGRHTIQSQRIVGTGSWWLKFIGEGDCKSLRRLVAFG